MSVSELKCLFDREDFVGEANCWVEREGFVYGWGGGALTVRQTVVLDREGCI